MMPDPTSSVPGLTDRRALDRNRARALRLGPVDFLHRIVADEIEDRLAEVNRRFSAVAVVTGRPQLWRDAMPGATVVADTPALALEPGAHDLVIHAMALHWAEDPVGQIAQAARAGLALPVADQITQIASYRSLFHLGRDLRAMGEGNALAQRLRRPTRRDVLLRAAALYAENHPDPQDGTRIRATFDLVFLTGWAPDASQQKPLRPGSARMSLAEIDDNRLFPKNGARCLLIRRLASTYG